VTNRTIRNLFLSSAAALCLSVGLVGQSLIQFVSSADAASDTVTSLIVDEELRDVIAEEIVERAEENNSDPTRRLLFVVARTQIAKLVANKLKDPVMADLIGDVVQAAYRVYVNGEQIVSVDVSRFGDLARSAISEVDSRLSTEIADNFEPLEITRTTDSPDLGQWIRIAKFVSWILVLLSVVATVIGWRLTSDRRDKQIQFVGVVVASSAAAIAAVVFLTRAIAPQLSDEYTDAVSVIADFVTTPALTRAVICGVIGVGLVVAARFVKPQPTATT
jgi:hypothetical protein